MLAYLCKRENGKLPYFAVSIERQSKILLGGRVMLRDTHINVFIGLSSVLRFFFFFCLRDSFVAGFVGGWDGCTPMFHMRK